MHAHTRGLRDERGLALLVALVAMLLLSALGAALLLTSGTETAVAAHFRDAFEAEYAADAGLERAVHDLQTMTDWSEILSTDDGVRARAMSGFAGGSLVVTLGDGHPLDLARATAALNCPQISPPPASCTDGQMNDSSAERPWGANNPRWHVYAHGQLRDLLPGDAIDSPYYLVVWVADDGAETDGNAQVDGTSVDNPGRGVIVVRAAAFGPSGTHRAVEATLARTGGSAGEGGYSGQRGDDELARGRPRAEVGTPGRGLTRAAMNVGAGGLR